MTTRTPLQMTGMSTNELSLGDVPREVLDYIFSLLAFEDISKTRMVSRTFNQSCTKLLNLGFRKAEKYHEKISREVKTLLPRRESERRTHFLAKHQEVLGAVETRLSLLSMTYGKYMEQDLCCFIPGKVLDELFRVLRLVDARRSLPRPHELLSELRDLSSMAMEHFDERIVPTLKNPVQSLVWKITGSPLLPVPILKFKSSPLNGESYHLPSVNNSGARLSSPFLDNPACSSCTSSPESNRISAMENELKNCKAKITNLEKLDGNRKSRMSRLSAEVHHQKRTIQDLRSKLLECTQKLLDLSREMDKKVCSTHESTSSIELEDDADDGGDDVDDDSSNETITRRKRGFENSDEEGPSQEEEEEEQPSAKRAKIALRSVVHE